MEQGDCRDSMKIRKRKSPENEEGLGLPLDELNQDLLERVLSWLPTSTFFRLGSVSKRWKSTAASATFRLACSQIPRREPWFFMVDSHLHHQWTVFDSAEWNWKNLHHPPLLHQNSCRNFIPVAASGGLICFRSESGDFVVCNPVTGSSRELPKLDRPRQSLQAIAMTSSKRYHSQPSYKLVLVMGEHPNLSFKEYNSSTNCWGGERILHRKTDSSSAEHDTNSDHTAYFISKGGDVLVTDIHRSPSKQYSSVITLEKGNEEVIYFFSSEGTIVACNLTQNFFFEYPRLLPVFYEYSIDLVECGGEMFVVVLSDFLESSSLRVWKFNECVQTWNQIAAMPPAMSHQFHGKKVDINCTGAGGNQILVCINSGEVCCYVFGDLVANEWIELPSSCMNGKSNDYMSAFCFEPRIEALV
ncbi:unnamed protein product [Ilex paraguariensis]|uniref:F-box domain-containing protein n=1 Tax=Ilex paraguariensis TaxID=185542 RepID=A0ABC8SA61_9AQUA